MRDRNKEIDIAKGIGILLVVACHANFAPLSPGRFFHMPLFFFLTGYLSTYTSSLGTMLVRKLKSLYLPFVFVELLLLVSRPLWIEMGITTASKMSVWEEIGHILAFDNISLLLAPIWFLTALFVMNIICFGLAALARRTSLYAALMVSMVLAAWGIVATRMGWMTMNWSVNFVQGMNVMLVAPLFGMMGYCCREWAWTAQKRWPAIVAVGYLYVAKLLLSLSVDMRANRYSSVLLFAVAVVLGIYMTAYLSHRLNGATSRLTIGAKRMLIYLGEGSLYVMLLHIFSFKLVGYMQVRCLGMALDNSGWGNPGCTGAWTIVYIIAGLVVPMGVYALVASGKAQYAAYRARKKAVASVAEERGDQ